MAEFLLIHGSCHGAWCWRDLIPALQDLGHHARAIDLPGNGRDATPLAEVTLESTVDRICGAMTPDSIVMGHSWGGTPITAAAERNADALRGLIYLCAYVPLPGHSMIDMRKRATRQPLADAVDKSPDGLSYKVRDSEIQRLFYHDCPDEAVRFAKAHLRPQAIAPQDTPVHLTDEFGKVPKAYIRCMDDRTIPPEYQVEMTQDWSDNQVHELATSHSPFFSAPQDLAALMSQIAKDM